MTRRGTALVVAAAACGAAWGHAGAPALIALAIALPLLWGLAGDRWSAGAIALAYYLAASRGLPFGVGIFFAERAPAVFGWALWLAAGCISAAPWVALWGASARRRALGAIGALVLTAIPPIGLVGWTNPMTAAGWWFPGMGSVGLVFAVGAAGALAARRWPVVAMFAGAAVVSNVCAVNWPRAANSPVLASWRGVDTRLPALRSANPALVASRVQLVTDLAARLERGQVVVLPETVLPERDARMSFAWVLIDAAAQDLRDRGAVVLVGAELPAPGKATRNALVALGDDSPALVQRVPVPIGMWRPWSGPVGNFVADPLGAGIGQVAGRKVAYVICYEQLLVYPVVASMMRSPEVLVGAANDWWARRTSIPEIQGATLDTWGRLYGVPVVRATNL